MNSRIRLGDLPSRPTRRRVICGCMFHHELDALDWRLHELDAVVDEYIVVESVRTHSGNPRELVHPDRIPRFAHFDGRLHNVVIDDPPEGPDPWIRERSQREAIWSRGAAYLASDDDLVIISDVDEVPFPDVVARLAHADFDGALSVRPHWFNFDWGTYLGPWSHASIRFYPAGMLRHLSDSGRGAEIGDNSAPSTEVSGIHGWHASWFGSDSFILDKLSSYSHAADEKDQIAIAEGAEGIQRRRSSGLDMYGGNRKLRRRPRLPVHAQRISDTHQD